MLVLAVEGLPPEPLAASADFHARVLPQALGAQADVLLAFAPADYTHRAWRLAAVQGLARVAVPYRVNAVASDDPAAIAAAQAFLAQAAGVTGQLLPLDSQGAGAVVN